MQTSDSESTKPTFLAAQLLLTGILSVTLPLLSLDKQGLNLEESIAFMLLGRPLFFIPTIILPILLSIGLQIYKKPPFGERPEVTALQFLKFFLFILGTNLLLWSLTSHQDPHPGILALRPTRYMSLTATALTLGAFIIRYSSYKLAHTLKPTIKVLLVTDTAMDSVTAGIIKQIKRLKLLATIDDPAYHHGDDDIETKPYENHISLLGQCTKNRAEAILISTSYKRSSTLLSEIYQCRQQGIIVHELNWFIEQSCQRIPVGLTRDPWAFDREIQVEDRNDFITRIYNVLFAIVALLIYGIFFFPVIVILMKIFMPGPIFFKQQRVGLFDSVFTLYKIRTMINGAPKQRDEDLDWAQKDDPRIPWLGRIIRKLKLDEFPQAINVIRGDMNIVGPRPQMVELVETFEKELPYYSRRHSILPGLTGWAQVNYQALKTTEDVLQGLQYDLYYVKHRSFTFDLHIIIKTIYFILTKSA